MPTTPRWKIYSAAKEYLASCKYIEDAAALVAARGENGTTIRAGHTFIVWSEGWEKYPASESYDYVAYAIEQRMRGEQSA